MATHLYAHPAFLEPFAALIDAAALARARGGEWQRNANVKLLARVLKEIDGIVANPAAPVFRQGNTLGPDRRHWCRAKWDRYRLFFRYRHAEGTTLVVLAWLNGGRTLRKDGARSDVYATFGKRLDADDPPDSWADLVSDAKAADAMTESETAFAHARSAVER